jgi:hypothetical protein
MPVFILKDEGEKLYVYMPLTPKILVMLEDGSNSNIKASKNLPDQTIDLINNNVISTASSHFISCHEINIEGYQKL